MQQQHVPAWKKLGLKLKFAKDTSDSAVVGSESDNSAVSKKRHAEVQSLSADTSRAISPTKKRRVETSTELETPFISNSSKALNPSLKRQSSIGLKKKVSFTAETKQLDGDSSKSLIAAWEADNAPSAQYLAWQAEVAEFELAQSKFADPELSESESPDSQVVSKSNRSSKPGQFKRKEKIDSQPRKSRDALDYLTQYHQARQTWKFNKNREVWILKHILSTDSIPPSYDLALAEYVHGLGSKAARARLIECCREVITTDSAKIPQTGDQTEVANNETLPEDKIGEAGMEDRGRRRAYRDEAKRAFKRTLEARLDEDQAKTDAEEESEDRKRLSQRRANLILESMNQSGTTANGERRNSSAPDSHSQERSNRMNQRSMNGTLEGTQNALYKKRKNRTAIIDISDESTSSEDGSDESSDEGSNGGAGDSNDENSSSPAENPDSQSTSSSGPDPDSTSDEEERGGQSGTSSDTD